MNLGAIYPARSAAIAAAAGAPIALVVAVVLPASWYAALLWPVAVVALVGIDALMGPLNGSATLAVPASAPVGASVDLRVEVRIDGRVAAAEVAVAADPLLALEDDGRRWIALDRGRGAGVVTVTATRRGTARIATLWLRWRGPLGLVWHQRALPIAAELPILPDIRPVRERGAALFQRHSLQGLIAQLDRGDGSEFETLVEYRAGMDRRAIDWKQSARHLKLHARSIGPSATASSSSRSTPGGR